MVKRTSVPGVIELGSKFDGAELEPFYKNTINWRYIDNKGHGEAKSQSRKKERNECLLGLGSHEATSPLLVQLGARSNTVCI